MSQGRPLWVPAGLLAGGGRPSMGLGENLKSLFSHHLVPPGPSYLERTGCPPSVEEACSPETATEGDGHPDVLLVPGC